MAKIARLTGALALGGLMATAVLAESHIDPAVQRAVDARQAHMTLYSFNLGTLGGMAQDKIPYDAAMAGTAASNLAALGSVDQAGYWIEGTDAGTIEDTRAKAEIWTDMADFEEKAMALTNASAALAEVAGTDLDSLKAAFGDVGKACGACHETYRVSDD
ncbi:c-type cytochrome [Loktanella sp. DJP18]|uniref:c-type cytochrome n=1 Tax=Loktanella sp. DJP18 TaxID=3409788 RepID=UPI003BB4BF20